MPTKSRSYCAGNTARFYPANVCSSVRSTELSWCDDDSSGEAEMIRGPTGTCTVSAFLTTAASVYTTCPRRSYMGTIRHAYIAAHAQF
jgi:hypothetical protein